MLFSILFCLSICCGSADSEGDISWLKDDEDVDEDRHEVKKNDESSSALTLNNIELDDSGSYTCVFENEHGTKKINYQLYVYRRFLKTHNVPFFFYQALNLHNDSHVKICPTIRNTGLWRNTDIP